MTGAKPLQVHWLIDGPCIRLRPEYPGHVWSYDFVECRTQDGRKFRILSNINEASRECLALPVARRLRSEDVLAALPELFITRSPPAHIEFFNGSMLTSCSMASLLHAGRSPHPDRSLAATLQYCQDA